MKAFGKTVSRTKQSTSGWTWVGRVASMVAIVLSGGMTAMAEDTTPAELYYVQLKSVVIPNRLLSSVINEKGKRAALADSRLYVEVSKNGAIYWRSPALEAKSEGHQEQFDFPQDKLETSFALMWKTNDNILVQVMVAENKALAKAMPAGFVGVGGALAGAAVGAAGAAACTGGLGAPAGAVIGAIVGAVGGGGAGFLLTPVKGAREIVSFSLPTTDFGLNGTLEKNVESADDMLLSGQAKIIWEGWQRQDKVASGDLDLQKKYVVRLRGVHLSDKARKYAADGDYYMLISLFGEEKPIELDLGKLPANAEIAFEKTVVLKNLGGDSAVEIRRKRIGHDDLVFRAAQGATNGKSWVFCGKAEDDNGSFVEFDTFPTEQ